MNKFSNQTTHISNSVSKFSRRLKYVDNMLIRWSSARRDAHCYNYIRESFLLRQIPTNQDKIRYGSIRIIFTSILDGETITTNRDGRIIHNTINDVHITRGNQNGGWDL